MQGINKRTTYVIDLLIASYRIPNQAKIFAVAHFRIYICINKHSKHVPKTKC